METIKYFRLPYVMYILKKIYKMGEMVIFFKVDKLNILLSV